MEIIVLRAFIYEREPQPPDTILDVPVAFGREMITAGKARAVNDADLKPKGPLDVSNAEALVPKKKEAAK
jgi:hypothetical protein